MPENAPQSPPHSFVGPSVRLAGAEGEPFSPDVESLESGQRFQIPDLSETDMRGRAF